MFQGPPIIYFIQVQTYLIIIKSSQFCNLMANKQRAGVEVEYVEHFDQKRRNKFVRTFITGQC
jgi:hypothetical protein